MSAYLKIAEQLVVDRLLGRAFPFTGKSKAVLMFIALAFVALFTALGFFIHGLHLWFVQEFEPHIAAILTGGSLMFVAFIFAFIAYIILYYKRIRVERMKVDIAHQVQSAFLVANTELGQPVKNNPKLSILAAALAGLIAGDKIL